MACPLVALSEDRPTRAAVAGLGIGFLGVLTVLGAWQGFSGLDAKGTVMALLAALSYPIGWIYVRRTLAGRGHSHLSLTGSQLLLATVQLVVVTPLFTSHAGFRGADARCWRWSRWARSAPASRCLLQYGLVAEIGPTTAQMVTYFIPVIATAAGVTLLGEPLDWNTPVGAVIVLAGAALTQSRAKARAVAPASAVAAQGGPLPGATAGDDSDDHPRDGGTLAAAAGPPVP